MWVIAIMVLELSLNDRILLKIREKSIPCSSFYNEPHSPDISSSKLKRYENNYYRVFNYTFKFENQNLLEEGIRVAEILRVGDFFMAVFSSLLLVSYYTLYRHVYS